MANEVYIVSAVRTPIGKHLKYFKWVIRFKNVKYVRIFLIFIDKSYTFFFEFDFKFNINIYKIKLYKFTFEYSW